MSLRKPTPGRRLDPSAELIRREIRHVRAQLRAGLERIEAALGAES
jgi:hypothetical protein